MESFKKILVVQKNEMESFKQILVVQKNEMESFKDRKNKNQVVQKNIKTKKAEDNYFNYECKTIYSSIFTNDVCFVLMTVAGI